MVNEYYELCCGERYRISKKEPPLLERDERADGPRERLDECVYAPEPNHDDYF